MVFDVNDLKTGFKAMNVACVQLDTVWKDKETNYASVRKLLNGAERDRTDLIVLPEMFATGFTMDSASVSESPGGPTDAFLSSLAMDYRACVIGGVASRLPEGRSTNAAPAFGPEGTELSRNSKLHPFSLSKEGARYCPGKSVRVFQYREFTIAPFICYDLRFPEVFREAVRMGANLFVVIASWPEARKGHWSVLLQARAIENQSYVVGVNRCGTDPKHRYSGESMVVDPRGEIIASAGSEESLVQAHLSLPDLEIYRREFPVLEDRRF